MTASVRQLLIGVIRDNSLFRANSHKRESADKEYRAVRPKILEKGQYRCVFCNWRSLKFSECHHINGDHGLNVDENLVVVDSLCHSYHHLGQTASQDQFAADSLGKKTVLSHIPEVSAVDLNLLQKALGAALLDKSEESIAKEILTRLAERAHSVNAAFGSHRPGDFAASMTKERMTQEQYNNAQKQCSSLRLIFREDVLKGEGKKFKEDFPALPPASWKAAAN